MVFPTSGPFVRTVDVKTVPLRAGNGRWEVSDKRGPTSQSSQLLRAPDLTAELPAHATRQAGRKPPQILRPRSETPRKAVAGPGRERPHKQGPPETKSTLAWTWERTDNMKFYLPLFASFCWVPWYPVCTLHSK